MKIKEEQNQTNERGGGVRGWRRDPKKIKEKQNQTK